MNRLKLQSPFICELMVSRITFQVKTRFPPGDKLNICLTKSLGITTLLEHELHPEEGFVMAFDISKHSQEANTTWEK